MRSVTEICEVMMVRDLDLLDKIQVQQEDGWLRPVPEYSKPIKVKLKDEKISPTSLPMTFESLVVVVEGLFKALT